MTYNIIVKFERELGDDEEIALKNYPTDNLRDALMEQFRAELQESYEDGHLAGLFKIIGFDKESKLTLINRENEKSEELRQERENILSEKLSKLETEINLLKGKKSKLLKGKKRRKYANHS